MQSEIKKELEKTLKRNPQLDDFLRQPDEQIWARLSTMDTSTPENIKAKDGILKLWALSRAIGGVESQSELSQGYLATVNGVVNKGTFFGAASFANRAKAWLHTGIEYFSSHSETSVITGETLREWSHPQEMHLAHINAQEQLLEEKYPKLTWGGAAVGIISGAAALKLATGGKITVGAASTASKIATIRSAVQDIALAGPAVLLPVVRNPGAQLALACVGTSASLAAINGFTTDGDPDAIRIGAVNGCVFGGAFSVAKLTLKPLLNNHDLAAKVGSAAILSTLVSDTPTTVAHGLPNTKETVPPKGHDKPR